MGNSRFDSGLWDLIDEPNENLDDAPAKTPVPAQMHSAQVLSDRAIRSVHVELVEADDGRWFRVLRGIVRSGFWASLNHRHQSLLIVMCELRDDETGVAFAPMHACTAPDGTDHQGLLALTGLQEPTIRQAIREMTASRPSPDRESENDRGIAAAGLLARLGRDTFSVLPGRRYAGRRRDHEPPPEPPDATASRPRCCSIKNDAAASKPLPAVRIPAPLKTNQPIPSAIEIGSNQNQVRATGRLVGWSGFGLFWNLDECTDPRQALLSLGVIGWLLEATLGLEKLTVEEISQTAHGVKSDASVRNPSAVLANRLFRRRGQKPPAPTSSKQLSGEWADLDRLRRSKYALRRSP